MSRFDQRTPLLSMGGFRQTTPLSALLQQRLEIRWRVRKALPASAVLIRFDELKVAGSRLLSFSSEPETGNPEPMPSSSLAASGDSGRIDGDKFH
jgi:hypothetical protein